MTEPTPTGDIDPGLAESHPDLAASMAAKAQEDAKLTQELIAIQEDNATGSATPTPPDAPPEVGRRDGVGPKVEHPAVPISRDNEPVSPSEPSSDRPAPPPRPVAESPKASETKPDKTENRGPSSETPRFRTEDDKGFSVTENELDRAYAQREQLASSNNAENIGNAQPPEPKPDKTDAELAEADKHLAWKIALERKDREVLNASEADRPLIEAEREGLEAKMRELFPATKDVASAEAVVEPEVIDIETLTPERVQEEMAASWERLKDLRRKEKPLLHDEMVISSRTGELKYDPDIVATHVDRWREEQYLALLDADGEHINGIKLSPVEIAAMTTYLKDQRSALGKEDVEEKARITEELALLKKYDKAVLKEWLETGGASWEEMEKLREKGQEWNDYKIEVPIIEPKIVNKPKEPPIDPIPDPPIDPIPNPPVEPPVEPRPVEPIPTIPEIGEAQAAYDLAVSEWAAARIDSERLLAGQDEKERLTDAKEKLDAAFENYCTALSRKHVENFYAWNENINLSADYVEQSRATQSKLEQQRALPPEDREDAYREFNDEDFAHNIQAQIEYQARQAEYQRQSSAKRDAEIELFNQVKVEELLKIRARVDAEMLAQREKKHPRLAKINEWLKKHPKSRIAAGLALTAIGITGTVTGLAPLAVLGFGGRTALGAYGAYNASRGVGEMAGDSERFGVGKETKATIGEELGAQEKQTNIRRYSKRAGAALAAIVGAIGAYKLANAVDRPPSPPTDQRYGSINNGELNSRLANGDFISGSERAEAIARLKGVIGDDAFARLGTQQREALLLLRNAQIDQAPQYFQHLAAGHFG